MRELGKELGLLGSSLYAHVESKQDLLVEVVESGARLFEAAAAAALATEGNAKDKMETLITGHVDVVLDNLAIARTFLNEARMLDETQRKRVTEVRDQYEGTFRKILSLGIEDGSFRNDLDPKTCSIFILSVLNALERWYDPKGRLNREQLVDELVRFAVHALR